ncbi:CLOCK-interacting pacemaker isoform X1 [Triplophysa rosa]|nr:CLOCK-interacting pacemaker isoform X1 [Triplophysa rosa]
MPKEPRGDGQGCVGERERAPHPASKNAKDKSNSATLLASRGRGHREQQTNGRDSRCSEKDSGYSDTGSDSLQTDADDQQSSVNEPQVSKRLGGVEQGPLQENHNQVPRTPELTPIFIIKNVVLKQPGQSGLKEHILPSSLSWGGGATDSQGPTHILLLQQPGINQSSPLHILKPQPQRTEGKGRKKSKNTYLPILNSYPRIAPHPTKKTPEKTSTSRGRTTEDHCLSKRVCTEDKREEVSTTTQASKQHKQQESNTLLRSHNLSGLETFPASHPHRSPCRPSSPPASLSVSSPSVSSTQTPSPPSSNDPTTPQFQARKESHKNCQGSSGDSGRGLKSPDGTGRHRRFLNTVEILSQSGLLDITLRTQDLLRQNAATEQDIAQLRQHAQLLCQAAQEGDDTLAVWEKLHQVMADSGHYPSLKCLCTDSSDGGGRSQSKVEVEAATSAKHDTHVIYGYGLNGTEEVAPPSPLLAPMPDAECHSSPEQSRVHRGVSGPPEEPIMPPDSSTHGHLN